MPTTCMAAGVVAEGDAVCLVDFTGGRPVVTRATASGLAMSRTVFGVAGAAAEDTEPVLVFVAGEAIEAARTGLDVGVGANTSRIVVTDVAQAVDADQCRLRRIDTPGGDVPPTVERFVVGTADEKGDVAIQPRHSSGETAIPKVYNVLAYGAVPDYRYGLRTGTDNLAAFERCLAAAKADGNSHAKIVAHGRFYLGGTLHIRQSVTIDGSGNSEPGLGTGSVRSAPGTWLIFPTDCDGIQFHTGLEDEGGADFSTLRGMTIWCHEGREGTPVTCPPANGHTGNGIFINCPVYLERITVENFAENGIYVSSGDDDETVHAGNAGGFMLTKCLVGGCGANGFRIHGRDATVGLLLACEAGSNRGWGFRDDTILGTTYVACHGEANRGFGINGNFDAWCEYSTSGVANSSVYLNCYCEGSINELGFAVQCIGGPLSLPQFQLHQDGSQGVSSSIGPANQISGMPLTFADTSGTNQTSIEFGQRRATGLDGAVLNFNTPEFTDYNILRWDAPSGWWQLNNSSPNGRISIQWPTTVGDPRRVAPLFANGIFFGTATAKGAAGASKALINHSSATTVPTDGTYEVSDIVWNNAVTPGGDLGWVCTTAGTQGTLAGVTGDIAIGTTTLTLSDTTEITPWQYIEIAGVSGVKQIITRAVGGIVEIDSAADSTVVASRVSFSAAVFKSCGTVGS